MANFDVRLIPEFSGESKEDSIAEWYSKATWLCKLHKVTDLTIILPLRLTGNAYKIYDQLSEDDKLSLDKVKTALFRAFEADAFTAYEQLHCRRLEHGEPVDAYLADIRRLAGLAGGMTEKAMCSAFVFGLPDHVRRILRTNSRMSDMAISELLECARAILADEVAQVAGARELAAYETRPCSIGQLSGSDSDRRQSPVCFSCGEPGHFQRGCARRRQSAPRSTHQAWRGATGQRQAVAAGKDKTVQRTNSSENH